jgi:hypothetical protein
LPEAKRLGMGVVIIKVFARGELLARPAAEEDPTGLARDMIAFVLENQQVDCCLCGVHTEEHVRENFSASWTALTPRPANGWPGSRRRAWPGPMVGWNPPGFPHTTAEMSAAVARSQPNGPLRSADFGQGFVGAGHLTDR